MTERVDGAVQIGVLRLPSLGMIRTIQPGYRGAFADINKRAGNGINLFQRHCTLHSGVFQDALRVYYSIVQWILNCPTMVGSVVPGTIGGDPLQVYAGELCWKAATVIAALLDAAIGRALRFVYFFDVRYVATRCRLSAAL